MNKVLQKGIVCMLLGIVPYVLLPAAPAGAAELSLDLDTGVIALEVSDSDRYEHNRHNRHERERIERERREHHERMERERIERERLERIEHKRRERHERMERERLERERAQYNHKHHPGNHH